MKPISTALLTTALAAALAACSESRPSQTAAPPAQTEPTTAPAASPKTAQGSGEVTAIDPAGGAVTINHGPIPAVGWPAMTMAFKANPPTLLEGIEVGDKVRFDVTTEGGGEVLAISKE